MVLPSEISPFGEEPVVGLITYREDRHLDTTLSNGWTNSDVMARLLRRGTVNIPNRKCGWVS